MQIELKIQERNLIVFVSGDIDHHSSKDVKRAIDKYFVSNNCKNIILNFEKVTFMDSSGIGMIIGRYKETQEKGGKLLVCNINNELKRIFDISGLLKIVLTYNNLEDACMSLK